MDPEQENGGNFGDNDDWGSQDDYDSAREDALSSWSSSSYDDSDYGYDKDGW